VLALCCVLAGLEPPPLPALRDAVFDGYQNLFPRERKSAPAVIVEIDERTLEARGQWPWPRSVMAELIAKIGAAHPAAIGLDLLFVEPDRSEPGSDGVLAKAIQGNNVVLAIAGLQQRDRRYPFPPTAAPVRLSEERELPLRRFDGHLQSRTEINRAAAGHGLISADVPDRIVRWVPMVARVGQVIVPALSLEMMRVAIGASGLRIVDSGGERVRVLAGDLAVPVQSNGSLYVYFGPHDEDRFVSAEAVLSGTAAPALLADKLVLVGVTGLGLLDFQATPLGERVPGVEVHAQILEQMFDGSYLRRPTGASWIEAALIALGGIALIIFIPAGRPVASALAFLGGFAMLAAVGVGAFHFGLLLNNATPAIGLIVVGGVVLASTLAEAERQRRLLREAQARVAGELEAARRIQMGLLPAPRERFSGERRFVLDAVLEPARTVGGDFYDCFMLDEQHLFFAVGDVTGKGLAASLFMALSKSLLKSIALRRRRDPGEIMARANAEISRDNRESLFVTVLIGVYDCTSGRLALCNAGHEPPVLCQPRQAPRRIEADAGPPLCVVAGYPYRTHELVLAPAGWLLALTDGVTEAMNEGQELYGTARLLSALRLAESASPSGLIAAVRSDVRRFAGRAEPSDDLTLLCLRRS